MAEFVDKDYLIKWIESRKRLSKMETILFIQDAPTTVLRDAVRCKDCAFFSRNTRVDRDRGDCLKYGYGCIRIKKLDDFCSYGERREGE